MRRRALFPEPHQSSQGFTPAMLTAELAQRKKARHAACPAPPGAPARRLRPDASHSRAPPQVLHSLLYRAKQRGFLELDLLVGGWAEANLPRLSDEELAAFGLLLEEENPDLWKWLTGQLPAPEAMAANPAFVQLRRHTEETLDAKSRSATRGKLGADWVRGWGDSGLPSSGNQQ